jgi:hypothetical protein
MKAYNLVPGVFGYMERTPFRAKDLTDGDHRIMRAMCLALLDRRAKADGISEWAGVVIAEGETADGYEMNMQMAIPVYDSESRK